jgi:hypothetical protein
MRRCRSASLRSRRLIVDVPEMLSMAVWDVAGAVSSGQPNPGLEPLETYVPVQMSM